MIRTGSQYRDSIRDGRAVFLGGVRVEDVASHPAFRPMVDLRARLFDMAHAPETAAALTLRQGAETQSLAAALPYAQADWWAKRRATDLVMETAGGIVCRTGDETIGEMWSLHDAAPVLAEIDPRFSPQIATHLERALTRDLFHVSANAGPRKNPLRVLRETDAGIVVRGAKYETAAAWANQAFVKATITDWGDAAESPEAVGFICDMAAPGIRLICRAALAGRAPAEDYPLTARGDEIDTLVVFDDVLIPWENVLYLRSTRAARHVRAVLHRYSAFAFVQRLQKFAEMMIGAALLCLEAGGLTRAQPVQEKLSALACWREGINAHLTAAIALAERSPGGLMMPNQSLLYAGRVLACGQLAPMMQLARELCGGQVCLAPDAASFRSAETAPWLEECYGAAAEEHHRLMAYTRDLLDSDHAGQRLNFHLFAQSPPYAQLAAVYRNFDWDGPLALVRAAAGLAGDSNFTGGDSAASQWLATRRPEPESAVA